jgi:hypothetical protein
VYSYSSTAWKKLDMLEKLEGLGIFFPLNNKRGRARQADSIDLCPDHAQANAQELAELRRCENTKNAAIVL